METLRKALRLNQIHLFGNSCGAAVVAEYMANNPTGIESIVFASPAHKHANVFRRSKQTKTRVAVICKRHAFISWKERHDTFQAYGEAVAEYYKRYLCRVFPYPKEVEETFKNIGTQVVEIMWGSAEFGCTGQLKGFWPHKYFKRDQTTHSVYLRTIRFYNAGNHQTVRRSGQKLRVCCLWKQCTYGYKWRAGCIRKGHKRLLR